jgi:4-amino-4-deoxy-L-arabinose transferase-like glycosyltransferase
MIPNEIITHGNRQALSDIYVYKRGIGVFLRNRKTRPLVFILVFSLLAILLFSNLGSPPVYILDEARNAQCAREMMQNHTLIVPTFNGKLRTDKPPLHYYFMMAAYKMFGVSSFSARFFSAVFGLLTLVLLAFFATKYLGKQTALLATIVLGSSTHFLFEFRLAVPDPYFIFFTLACMLSSFVYLTEKKTSFLYAAAFLAAMATLAKGPVAVVLPVSTVIIFAAYKRNWERVFTWHMLSAFAVFIAVAAPWYVLVHNATNGEWTRSFFIDHNLERFSAAKEGHAGFFLMPLAMCLLGLLPFSTFVAGPIRNRKLIFKNDAVMFSLIAFLAIVVFFSLSATQLPNYSIPAYPFAAIVMAAYLSRAIKGRIHLPSYPLFVSVTLFFILPLLAYYLLNEEAQTKHLVWLAATLVIPAMLFLLLALSKRISLLTRTYAIAGISFLFNIIILLVCYPMVYRNNPVAKTLPILQKATAVVAYRHYNAGYNFYLAKPIQKLDANQIDSLTNALPGTIVITSAALLKELDLPHLKTVAIEHDIFERRETVLLSREQP